MLNSRGRWRCITWANNEPHPSCLCYVLGDDDRLEDEEESKLAWIMIIHGAE